MEGQIEQLKEQEKELQKTILKDKEILKSNKKKLLIISKARTQLEKLGNQITDNQPNAECGQDAVPEHLIPAFEAEMASNNE